MLFYMGKRSFVDVIKFRILRWGHYPGLSDWSLNAITCILIRKGRGRSHRHRGRKQCDHGGRDASNVTTSQAMPAATRNWKSQGTDSPLEPLEGAWSCQHPDFGPVILISDFWPIDM